MPEALPAWIPCPGGCDDWWCTRHGQHVSECACPPIEEWAERDLDPYTTGGLPLPEELRHAT